MTIFAHATDYTVLAESGDIVSRTYPALHRLTDESGVYLIDETGAYLVAPFSTTTTGETIQTLGTDYTIHAEA